jgi:hypothetical protein
MVSINFFSPFLFFYSCVRYVFEWVDGQTQQTIDPRSTFDTLLVLSSLKVNHILNSTLEDRSINQSSINTRQDQAKGATE